MRSNRLSKEIKLSKRLQALYNLIDSNSHALYDLCCDHGDLGLKTALNQLVSKIYLIDRVPSIIDNLTVKLKATDIPSGVKIFPQCIDLSKTQISVKNSTIVLAGIGEDTAISILKRIRICDQSRLILSIHSENFALREYLRSMEFGLISETVVKDKGKLYEILKVSRSSIREVRPVGSEQWSVDNLASLELLSKRIRYLSQKISHVSIEKYEDYLKELKQRSENLS